MHMMLVLVGRIAVDNQVKAVLGGDALRALNIMMPGVDQAWHHDALEIELCCKQQQEDLNTRGSSSYGSLQLMIRQHDKMTRDSSPTYFPLLQFIESPISLSTQQFPVLKPVSPLFLCQVPVLHLTKRQHVPTNTLSVPPASARTSRTAEHQSPYSTAFFFLQTSQ